MIIQRGYKVRLYPNKEQEQKMLSIIGACRWVYNHFLEQRKNYYLEHKKTLPYAEMSRNLTQLRYKINWLSEIQTTPLQQSLRCLDKAYNNFFRKISNFPKFKSKKDNKQTFRKFRDFSFTDNKLQIQKDLLVNFRGNLPNKYIKLGTLTVSKENTGKWFASILFYEDIQQPKKYNKSVGIDVGLKHLVITSNGKKYSNIQPQKTLQKKLKKAQQDLSRKKIGSTRREKQKVVVARLFEKIKNIRQDYLHKTSHSIVSKNHALIAVEDLSVKNMLGNRRLSRAISDASWSELIKQLEYKQNWKGGKFIKIGKFFPSSKTCSNCGFLKDKLPLNIRKWVCPKCGIKHDRDINAAKMILKMAESQPALRVRKTRSNTK